MDFRVIFFIAFLLLIGKLQNVNGFAEYKWVSLRSGDKLPENVVSIYGFEKKYIGRARHFDEILPAEVTEKGSATISSCHKKISKDQFEVLTTLGGCQWKLYFNDDGVEETILRVGTAWNGEPIFVGTNHNYENNYDDMSSSQYIPIMDESYDDSFLTSIYLTKGEPHSWLYDYNPNWRYLSCNAKNLWVDSSSIELPNNAVAGEIFNDEDAEMYVAQLKRGCTVVTGTVIPEMRIAKAFLKDGTPIDAAYCQVLVGEPTEYSWYSVSDGEIPDYAVVNGRYGNELEYVAMFNNAIGHLTHKEALDQQIDYSILVMNQPKKQRIFIL